MSDAPMTPDKFVRKIINAIQIRSYSEDALVETFADRDTAIRREAQAEALEQAASLEKNEMEAIRKMGGEHVEVELLKSKIRLNSILNLSPDPRYRERIVAQARLEEAEQWATEGDSPIMKARLVRLRADLARLAADAPTATNVQDKQA